MLSTRDLPQNRGHIQTESEGLEKDFPGEILFYGAKIPQEHIRELEGYFSGMAVVINLGKKLFRKIVYDCFNVKMGEICPSSNPQLKRPILSWTSFQKEVEVTTTHFVCPPCVLQRCLSYLIQWFSGPLDCHSYPLLPDLPFPWPWQVYFSVYHMILLSKVEWLNEWEKKWVIWSKKHRSRRNTLPGSLKIVVTVKTTPKTRLGGVIEKAVYCMISWELDWVGGGCSVTKSVQLFATPWTAACQASLSITISQSLLKLMSIKSVMPSNHFILCRPLLLPPSIFPSIIFPNESALHIRWPKCWSFSFSISPSTEYSGLISFRMDWLDLLAVQGTLKSLLQHQNSKALILWWVVEARSKWLRWPRQYQKASSGN